MWGKSIHNLQASLKIEQYCKNHKLPHKAILFYNFHTSQRVISDWGSHGEGIMIFLMNSIDDRLLHVLYADLSLGSFFTDPDLKTNLFRAFWIRFSLIRMGEKCSRVSLSQTELDSPPVETKCFWTLNLSALSTADGAWVLGNVEGALQLFSLCILMLAKGMLQMFPIILKSLQTL
ncbi:unnamed protein product [Sphenostylis stenocarpa]|uniref:Uncharacterized protein n=1 Tax=Sphenostylis stenocarpa TaxID=92480 RepID=A0AA86TBB1_9FABA|nr:unnamed protein product [Sphenostylis stenocarpa]